jgi:hypothetical protein
LKDPIQRSEAGLEASSLEAAKRCIEDEVAQAFEVACAS